MIGNKLQYAAREVIKPYVIVRNAGDTDEKEMTDYADYGHALLVMKNIPYNGDAYDVMKRLPDGTLTTEF